MMKDEFTAKNAKVRESRCVFFFAVKINSSQRTIVLRFRLVLRLSFIFKRYSGNVETAQGLAA